MSSYEERVAAITGGKAVKLDDLFARSADGPASGGSTEARRPDPGEHSAPKVSLG